MNKYEAQARLAVAEARAVLDQLTDEVEGENAVAFTTAAIEELECLMTSILNNVILLGREVK